MASYEPESSVYAAWSDDADKNKQLNKARKFQSLNVSDTYKVMGAKPINTEYGKSYILLVKHIVTGTDFDLFSTSGLTTYIDSGKDITGGFTFIVKCNDKTNIKYAFILF